jgi:hypothetical protein
MFNVYEWLFIICDELPTMTYTYFNIIPEKVEYLKGWDSEELFVVVEDHHEQL